jgi:Domain of unknown function (DUF4157)
MGQVVRPVPPRRRLRLDDSAGTAELSADRSTVDVLTQRPGGLSRSIAGLDQASAKAAPASVRAALAESGHPLGASVRDDLERRYGHDFGAVRVHTDAGAARSARDVGALAYTVGQHVAFGAGSYAPDTPRGRHVLAHELAHVVQGGPADVVRRYRAPTAMAFGELDTATLVEQSFDAKTDRNSKPWIELVTVEFTGTATDDDGNTYWTGIATAKYHANPVKLADLTFIVAGGSAELGRTDAGSFTVFRIEGYGYNSGTYSGTPDLTKREPGALWHYTKKNDKGRRPANMSLAVFYNKGEALHVGPIDYSSHGCVHVNWDAMEQVNYHSVVGLTKVTVSYPRKP